MNGLPVYSAVCETSVELYAEYLRVCEVALKGCRDEVGRVEVPFHAGAGGVVRGGSVSDKVVGSSSGVDQLCRFFKSRVFSDGRGGLCSSNVVRGFNVVEGVENQELRYCGDAGAGTGFVAPSSLGSSVDGGCGTIGGIRFGVFTGSTGCVRSDAEPRGTKGSVGSVEDGSLGSDIGQPADKCGSEFQTAGRDGGTVGGAADVGGVGSRGKHYQRNRNKRLRRQAAVRAAGGIAGGAQASAASGVWRSPRVEAARSGGVGEVGGKCTDNVAVEPERGFGSLPLDVQKKLKASYADRLQAENELKAFTARRRLELEQAKDVSQLKKRQETLLMSQTEMNKVRAEKAFATLARTDNVPGVVGSAQTVASSGGSSGVSPVFSGVGSGTISPNSSISLAEIHALQKRELEKTHENDKLKARLEKLQFLRPEVYKELGFLHALPPTVGTGVTVDENGSPIGDYGDGFGGYLGDDGRFHFGENYDNY